jgi:hypothetical protein
MRENYKQAGWASERPSVFAAGIVFARRKIDADAKEKNDEKNQSQ